MSKHFWLGFEKYIKNKFPSYIKNILVNSGYDNELSISKLNNESINDIEIFVTANRNLLKNSIYEKSSEKKFSFLPGHRHLLLDLPNQLRDFKNSKQKKEKKTIKDFEVLRSELLIKLNSVPFIKRSSLTQDSLTEFSVNNTICKVSCPLCEKKFACHYYGYWSVANLKRHWKQKHCSSNPISSNNSAQIEHIYLDNNDMLNDLIEYDDY